MQSRHLIFTAVLMSQLQSKGCTQGGSLNIWTNTSIETPFYEVWQVIRTIQLIHDILLHFSDPHSCLCNIWFLKSIKIFKDLNVLNYERIKLLKPIDLGVEQDFFLPNAYKIVLYKSENFICRSLYSGVSHINWIAPNVFFTFRAYTH